MSGRIAWKISSYISDRLLDCLTVFDFGLDCHSEAPIESSYRSGLHVFEKRLCCSGGVAVAVASIMSGRMIVEG